MPCTQVLANAATPPAYTFNRNMVLIVSFAPGIVEYATPAFEILKRYLKDPKERQRIMNVWMVIEWIYEQNVKMPREVHANFNYEH